MGKALTMLLLAFSLNIAGQTQGRKHYIYNIFELSRNSKNIKERVDNGQTIEEIKNADGKTIKFKTAAGVLMYLTSLGWDFYTSQDNIKGVVYSGSGGTSTTTRWIMRKPATKEEVDEALKNIIKE